MGDVVLNRVQRIPFLYGGCGIKGVTCMGNAQALVVFEEVSGLGSNPQRIFTSEDNGASWTEGAPYLSDESLWVGKAFSTGLDTVLVGTEGPLLCMTLPDPVQGIARTTDGGVTWASPVDGDLSNSCAWTYDGMFHLLRLSATEVWALGAMGAFASMQQIIKSVDNGVTFLQATFDQVEAGTTTGKSGVVVAPGIIVLGGSRSGQTARVWRSTDGGANWSTIVLPNTQHAAFAGSTGIVDFLWSDGTNVVAAGSQRRAVAGFPPKVWRSTDQGATWAEITDSIPNFTASNQNPVVEGLDLGGGRILLALSGRPDQLGASNYRLSEDAGVTWANATVGAHIEAQSVAVFPFQMAHMDDGSVIVTLDYLGGNKNEIWRGIPDFESAGPCSEFEPPVPPPTPVVPPFELQAQAVQGRISTRIVGTWRP